MTVFDCLKPSTLNAVGNDDRMLRIKFVVVCKSPGGRDTLSTVKCPAPGTHCETNARGLPGGMFGVGIDSHISALRKDEAQSTTGGHSLSCLLTLFSLRCVCVWGGGGGEVPVDTSTEFNVRELP